MKFGFGLSDFMDAGVKVIVTPEQGEPLLLKTILQLDGDTVTFAHPKVLKKKDLCEQHFERVEEELRGIRRLRLGLNTLYFSSTAVPIAHVIASFAGDWKAVFSQYAPYTILSLVIMAIRPVFFAFLRRKLTRGLS